MTVASFCVRYYKLHKAIKFDMKFQYKEIPNDTKGSLQIFNSEHSFAVYAKTPEEKAVWMGMLTKCINKWEEESIAAHQAATKPLDDHYVPPVWEQDHSTTACPLCRKDFGLINRRHHCRKCGSVVCGKCSKVHTRPRPHAHAHTQHTHTTHHTGKDPAQHDQGGERASVRQLLPRF